MRSDGFTAAPVTKIIYNDTSIIYNALPQVKWDVSRRRPACAKFFRAVIASAGASAPTPTRIDVTQTAQLRTALADRYTIERLIGEGGMATVYLALDVRHNRRVALK